MCVCYINPNNNETYRALGEPADKTTALDHFGSLKPEQLDSREDCCFSLWACNVKNQRPFYKFNDCTWQRATGPKIHFKLEYMRHKVSGFPGKPASSETKLTTERKHRKVDGFYFLKNIHRLKKLLSQNVPQSCLRLIYAGPIDQVESTTPVWGCTIFWRRDGAQLSPTRREWFHLTKLRQRNQPALNGESEFSTGSTMIIVVNVFKWVLKQDQKRTWHGSKHWYTNQFSSLILSCPLDFYIYRVFKFNVNLHICHSGALKKGGGI